MLNKVLSILGILIIVLSVVGFVYFDSTIRANSEALGANVLIARDNIPEGTVMKNGDMVKTYFKVVRIARSQIVPGAVTVGVRLGEGGIINAIKAFFDPARRQIADSDLAALIGRRTTVAVLKNQQIVKDYIVADTTEFGPNERLFAVNITYTDSVGAEIRKGDYVDLWIRNNGGGSTQRVIGPLKVIKLKDANNEEITGTSKAVPKLVIFKLTNEQIAAVSTQIANSLPFLVKYGVTPTDTTPVVGNLPATTPTVTIPDNISIPAATDGTK